MGQYLIVSSIDTVGIISQHDLWSDHGISDQGISDHIRIIQFRIMVSRIIFGSLLFGSLSDRIIVGSDHVGSFGSIRFALLPV